MIPKTQEKKFVYQNSWGITTRTIGVMVMVHGDDKGLVLPPRVAPVQVVIMPVGITASTTDEVKQSLINYCTEVEKELTNKDIKTRLGPRELAENKVFAVRRDTGEKQSLDKAFIERRIYNLLETIQKDMFDKAMEDLQTHKTQVNNWQSFLDNLDKGNIILAPSCGIEACEEEIKKTSAKEEPSEAGGPSMGAKGLCIPFEQPG
ncbi:putative proline--tRNA ligase [Armadillidium vulgare]|nr:putative proline--tRNA ligase [Armadillidium vulgare]